MLYDHRVAIAIRCSPGSGRPSRKGIGRRTTDADLKTAKNVIDGL